MIEFYETRLDFREPQLYRRSGFAFPASSRRPPDYRAVPGGRGSTPPASRLQNGHTFQGTWLVGFHDVGSTDHDDDSTKKPMWMWSIARSTSRKFVCWDRRFAEADGSGSITIAATHEELKDKIPASVYAELRAALGLLEPYRTPELPLDV